MIYNRNNAKEKWTIMMYMRNFELMVTYAYALRSSNELSVNNIDDILIQMEKDDIYHPRNGGCTFTGQFKSIQIAWYMFGYYNKHRKKDEQKKLVFSPLGNLLLDNLKDKEKVSKIFLAMLFGNGFRQPFSQMDERFNLYAFRLIFKLLRDSRLEYKLYNDEVFYYVMFTKTIDRKTYEELINDIMNFRKLSSIDKLSLFKKNERVVGLACHEWNYATGMLESADIVSVCNDYNDRVIGQLTYGNISKVTGRPNAVRQYREDYIVINPKLADFTDKLLLNYSPFIKPYPDDEITRKFNSAMIVEMYSFYPPELLEELGMNTEEDKAIATMLNIASDINYYSRKETSTGEKFEYALTDAFNLFSDVDAERIGGAGNSDIECVFFPKNGSPKKFDIEAKSTSRKLIQINSQRLRIHRFKIGSLYTIIITPNYSIGVLRDIEGEDSVIIKSATLSNFLYQYILKSGRNISHSILDKIIVDNIGFDITDKVNDYVYSNFGHSANDLNVNSKNNSHHLDK